MRILYFLAHPESIGGASNVLLKQASFMKKAGHDVFVVIQNNDDNNHAQVIDDTCKKYNLDYTSCSFSISVCIEEIDIERSIQDIENIRAIIDKFKADIVHSLQINTSVELSCRELGVPHVMSIYPLSDGMFNLKWDDVFPSYLISDSEYYTKRWGDGLGIESKCIRVSYDAKDCLPNIKEQSRDCVIVSMGVLCSFKNQLEIIKFAEKALKRGIAVRVILLGDCHAYEYGEKCKRYIKEHNLSDSVIIKGFVQNIEEYLKSADLLIHASRKDSYPGVIVEAMANKVPVMATTVGGIPELLRDGENGFCIDGFDSEDILVTFEKFITSKRNGTLADIIKRGYETYLNNHKEEVVRDELEKFYLYIIQNTCTRSKSIQTIEEMKCDILVSKHHGEYSSFAKSHKWFLKHIHRELVKDKVESAYIWGAGNYGRYALEWCNILNLKIKGVFDSFKEGNFQGYTISKPDISIIESNSIIFVAIFDFDTVKTIVEYLEKNGFIRNRNFFLLRNDSCM